MKRTANGMSAVATALAVVVGVGGSCAVEDEPEALPTPSATSFTESGAFDAIPRYPRSEAVGPRREMDDAVIRSWWVRNANAELVLRFYEDQLDGNGWDLVSAPHAVNDSWRGSWRSRGALLEVSATPAPALEQNVATADPVTVQYSLVLRPE